VLLAEGNAGTLRIRVRAQLNARESGKRTDMSNGSTLLSCTRLGAGIPWVEPARGPLGQAAGLVINR